MTPAQIILERLAELRKVEEVATPGPWTIHIGFDRFSSSPGCYGAYLEMGNEPCNVLVSAWSDGTKEFVTTSRNTYPVLLKALERAVEALTEFQLGHEHAPDLPHTRAMGDSYGWCDYCLTKVTWGPGYAEQSLEDVAKMLEGK